MKCNRKWLILGLAVVLVLVLSVVFVLSLGGINKYNAVCFEVEDLTCYVPSDWICEDSGSNYEIYKKDIDDGYMTVGFQYWGTYEPEAFAEERNRAEADDDYEVVDYSVRGADDSFLMIYQEEENLFYECYYMILWEDECYMIDFVADGVSADVNLFENIVKSVEFNG